MDVVLLRSLVAVADSGTITDAAERISISQSALSRRLQQLEVDLGAQLLVRAHHGVELTDLGRQAVEQARTIVSRYDRLRQDISDQLHLERGTVRVGGGATVTSYLLPPAIARFQASYPDIRFYVKEAGSRDIAAAVSSGDLDLGVVTLPVPARDLDVAEIYTDQVVLVAPLDHPFCGRRVACSELEGEAFVAFEPGSAIRQIIDDALRYAGVEIETVMELRSVPSILRMVATTGNLAFASRLSLVSESGLREIPVEGLAITRSLALTTRRAIPLSAPAAAFAAYLDGRHGGDGANGGDGDF